MSDLAQVLKEIRDLRKELRTPAKRLLTVDEAAHYLGLAPKTIRNMLSPTAISNHKVRPFPVKPVRVGGSVRFRLEDLEKYVDGLEGSL